MKIELYAQNIKCGGCENSITSALNKIDGVSNTAVDSSDGIITVDVTAESLLQDVRKRLNQMGYPEKDSTIFQSTKSYVSCAIGRFQKSKVS